MIVVNFENILVEVKKEKTRQREDLQKKQHGTFDKYVFRSNEIIEEENALISKLDETNDYINVENNQIEN